MKLPTGGPRLRFAFYCDDVPEAVALARVVTALLDLGAVFQSGWGTIRADGDKEDISSAPALAKWLTDPRRRLQAVVLAGATDTTRKFSESVSYDQISEEAACSDHPAIAIETDGHWIEHWLYKDGERQARSVWRRAKKRFCSLVAAVRPAYAAIMTETYLPCPTDMGRGSRHTTFSNFFVSSAYLGRSRLEQMRALFDGAYVEQLTDGLYISCYELFNPGRVTLGWDGGRRSEQGAALIASVR